MPFPRFLLLAVLCASAAFAQPQRATVEQWRSDIDYLASELPKRHPNPFTFTSRQDFLAQLNAVKADVPQLSDVDIVIRLQKAVASLRDAHTSIDTNYASLTFFPLIVYPFTDGFFVTRTAAEARNACGARLVAVDGVAADDILARFGGLISHENDEWVLARTNVMLRAENLYALGVTAARDHARFEFERQGAQFELDLHAIDASAAQSELFSASSGSGLPLYRQQSALNYWYVWEASRRLLYLKYNVCQNDPRKSMDAMVKEIFAIVDAQTVDRFVVDVRNNEGGNSAVAQPLIDALAKRPALRGRTYGIIGRETFSSGLFAAYDLLNRDGAILAGEPTGGKPNGYGDVLSFALPATRVNVTHSTKHFDLIPGDPPSLDPMISVAPSASDYFGLRDPVLETILAAEAGPATTDSVVTRRRAVSPAQTRRCE
jgi:hypothetical protein